MVTVPFINKFKYLVLNIKLNALKLISQTFCLYKCTYQTRLSQELEQSCGISAFSSSNTDTQMRTVEILMNATYVGGNSRKFQAW